jgi:hypothetical protein
MKKVILFLGVIAAIVMLSFKFIADKRAAQVNQAQGYFIFMQSQPVAEYKVLGTVKKTGLTLSGDPTEMFNTILKKTKKEYPDADGIIFENVDMQHATCIKFKD